VTFKFKNNLKHNSTIIKQETKIVLLICYFGKLPWYFKFFLHSCKYNPDIHFYIITDNNKTIESLPSNVKIVVIPNDEMKQKAFEKFGFTVCIDNPYKLCDFKPAYGYLFPELIEGYDFWGHGDIDVIFGKIRNFITHDVLSNHDLICVRHDFLTGYFQLFRNNEKMNTLFMKSKDYKKVFTSPQHYCFDETNFAWDAFAEGKPLQEMNCEIESMNHVVRKLQDKKEINAYFDFHVIEGLPGRLKWQHGTLTYKNEFEVMLYHMVLFKKFCKNKLPPKKIPDTFYISPSRIYF